MGLTTIFGVIEAGANTPLGYIFKWDTDDTKLTAYYSNGYTATTNSAAALTEASTVNLAATPVRFLVIGE